MPSTSSHASSTFNADTVITTYTMEFWMKAPGGYNSDATLLSLAENGSRRKQYMVI